MEPNSNGRRARPRGVSRRRFLTATAIGAGVVGLPGIAPAQETTSGIPDARPVSSRDLDSETTDVLYTYRKRRALEVLLSDPEVHTVAEDMVSSFEAYEPYTDRLDAISVQGSPGVEIEGGLDEGAFDVTAVDRRVAYGLVDRGTDDLVALTITEPQDVSWRAWEADDDTGDAAQLRRVLEEPRVREYVDGTDWFPLVTIAGSITSARGIAHGDVNPIVLFVDEGDAIAALVAYLDVGTDDAGDVIDVTRVERFVEFPPHEVAAAIAPVDDTVLGTVPEVPFERRPWYTADEGSHRIEDLSSAFNRADWFVEWESPENHGVEIAASYRDRPVFASVESPVTYTGYGLPERDGESTLEWFFPDDDPVFSGESLLWDVHSTEFGGPGALGVIDYPETADRPAGFRFRSHYQTGAQDSENRDHLSGYRFGQSSHELSYEFWADGTVVPIWRRQGPGFVTEYATSGTDSETGSDTVTDADGGANGNGTPHHSIATFAMDVTPGTTDGVDVEYYDGSEWTTPETEFYRVGEPGTLVRISNPDGSETIYVPLDHGVEVVVARRASMEIPGQQRLENMTIESAFYHPAQYLGNESIQGERVVVWLLLEAATAALPHPTGTTSFLTHTEMRLSGY